MIVNNEKLDKSALKTALRQSFSEVVHSIELMPKTKFSTPIKEGKWSPGQHLGHLWLSTKSVRKGMAIPKLILKTKFGICNRDERTYQATKDKYDTVIASGIAKAGPRYTVEVVEAEDKEEIINAFNKELHQLIAQIDKWSEKELSKFVLPHPAIGKLSFRELLMFTDLHTRHHHKAIVNAMK